MDDSGDIDVPQPNAGLPSRKDIVLTAKQKQPHLPVDALLVTVNDSEFLACCSRLEDSFQWHFESLGYVYFADIDKHQGGKLKVALIRCPGTCIGSGSLIVKNAVHVLRPKAVFFVGTCTGLNSKNTKLGDVVVSSKLTTYTSEEAMVNQVQSTAKRRYVSRCFSNVIKNCADGWQAPLKNSEAREVRIHFGEFLIGSGHVDTKWQHKQLAELHPQAVAIEMDGEGIFAAACDLALEWVIVKGIADFEDTAQLAAEHSWHSFASTMAASLVAHILSDPGVFCSWPHFGEPSSQLLPKLFSIPEKGSEDLLAILKCLRCQDINVEKSSNGIYLQEWINPSLEGVKMSDKHFKTLHQSVKLSILKPWSDSQYEFVVLECNDNDDFNVMNCLAILSLFAFTKGDTNSLVEIQAIALRYKHHPGCGFMMSNLGVMFSEKVDYEKSKECFDIAKGYFDFHQDHLGCVAVTLNKAVLHYALGDYAMAQSLCYEAAVICPEISVKTPKSALLLFKVLGRAADILEEIGDYETFNKILKTCAHSDITGGSKTISVVLIQQVMKLQLKNEATEVKDFVYYLFTLLDKAAAALMNAVVVQTVVIATTLHRSAGYQDEAYDLLKKLQNTVLLAHGRNSCLYGSLLYQIGCVLVACEKFDEALSAVKQAAGIFISRFGQGHHTVALCLNMLGSCFLLKGNKEEALKHLNEALTKFRNLNSNHPEMGGILLKLAFLNFEEEADVQCAHDSVERALEIFISSCGELSPKTATGYVQSAMFLLKDKALWSSAEEKLMTAIDIFLRLGLKPAHSCVIACRSLLGVLQLSLRKTVQAEKSFVDVNQQFDLNNELWFKTKVALAPSFSLLIPSAMVGLDRSSSLCAKIVALVNLVHMKNGNERHKLLDVLVGCVEKHKIEQLQICDFAGQDVYCVSHKLPHSDRPIVCVLSSDPDPLTSDSSEGLSHHSFKDTSEAHGKSEGSHMFLSSINKHFVLFLRVSHNIHQKGNFYENCNFLDFSLYMSVVTLFSQPSLQKHFMDRNDFYRELILPTRDMSSSWSLIECLPLLVELELSELQEQCDYFDYLNSWESSVKPIEPPVHISYFSSKCSSQREAEFVFDGLSHRLEEKLEGDKSQGVVICDVFPGQNAASFVTEKPHKSFIAMAVEGKVVIVKCCSFKESDLHCVCSLVNEALENVMEPNHVVSVNCEQSSWLRDLGSFRGFKESFGENCSSDVTSDLFCADLTLETGELMPCASRRDPESDLYREPTFDELHDKDARLLLSHPFDRLPVDTDVCLSLLECLLSQARLETLKEEDLRVRIESLPSFDSCDGDINDNQNRSISSSLSNKSEGPSGDLHDSNPRPSSAASSVSTVSENLPSDFENVLAASQEQCLQLQQEIGQLKEQLKQSEEEKQKLQVDLGKYLFFKEKEKRCGRLLGGAASLHEPGFSVHSRLLEISNALTEEEVKKIKFLAKSKINGFRLARITEAFELFEELETNGGFPCRYIANLLAAIQRHDLVEKLGIQIPSTAARERSDHPFGQGSSARGLSCLVENASKLPSAQDYTVGLQHNVPQTAASPPASISGNSVHVKEDNESLTKEGEEVVQSQNSSLAFSESSSKNNSDTAVSSANEESCSSSMKSALSTDEFSQFLASDVYLSNSNENLSSSSSFEKSAVTTYPRCTLQASSDSTDSSLVLTLPSGTSIRNGGISSDGSYNTGSGKEQNLRRSQNFGNTDNECDGSLIVASLRSSTFECNHRNTPSGEGELLGDTTEKPECEEIKEEKKSVDSCDGAIGTVHFDASDLVRTNYSDSSTSEIVRTKSLANGGNSPTEKDAFSAAEGGIRIPSSDGTDWGSHGARPKQPRHRDAEQVRTEPVVYVTDGLAGDFLARHTQDKALHDSIYQTRSMLTFNDIPSRGASYIDGDISQFNRVQPYFGDCQVAPATDPYGRSGNLLANGSNGGLGGYSYTEHFGENSGPSPSYSGDGSFSLYSNFLSRNNTSAGNSDFVHSSGRFTGDCHLDRKSYLPLAQQVPDPHTPSSYVVSNNLRMNHFRSEDPLWAEAAQTQLGDHLFTNTSNEPPGDSVHNEKKLTGDGDASASIADQNTDEAAQAPDFPPGNSSATANIDGLASSSAINHFGDTATVGSEVLAGASCHGTSISEPRLRDAENSTGLVLNNRDFGNDSVESSDNSLLALERRVAEGCALVERVLREREEREQFGREIERKEQLIREQRAKERREREERELREAESWPQQQEAINARSQWLCEHYQRHCRVRFPCCTKFYPCHRCHNISKACENEEAKACHATHLKCSLCQHEQEIGKDSAKCRKCGGKMSAYFCSICKHFTSVDKNPYHCEKCGICRIHQDKSFHCEVCNVCLDKRLEGKHKCRPDSGHDECCICLEDAFSGCQILPCSHKVHRECAIAMIQNGIRTCPICRHPLYSQPRE